MVSLSATTTTTKPLVVVFTRHSHELRQPLFLLPNEWVVVNLLHSLWLDDDDDDNVSDDDDDGSRVWWDCKDTLKLVSLYLSRYLSFFLSHSVPLPITMKS